MKTCFKCHQELPLGEFYKHKMMGDGHLGKCKECTKSDVKENRDKNIERYREYDRARGNRQTPEYRASLKVRFPVQYKAQNIVGNAIRDKRLFRERCESCDCKETHAHHDDYSKPLNVRWLCAVHHHQWHAENGPGLNRGAQGSGVQD